MFDPNFLVMMFRNVEIELWSAQLNMVRYSVMIQEEQVVQYYKNGVSQPSDHIVTE